ncbi:MAG TPA: condensation domain-containing protein [Actinophytocola sp.]|uniref:condensation domain-containing protein n=1 Tax=Actinophytocola sp. TaxID=1872138 RepID=UPI002E072C7B|nr:condensation domain-containing protein [Actinophytocola sp.]
MGQLEVEFTGLRAGSGPVTLGQANVLEWIGVREQERSEVLCSFVPVPAGCGVEDVRASLAILLARHEALRTTVEPGPPATQTVRGSGRLVAELHEIDGADVESVLRERIVARRFDFGRDLPFRVAVATRDGVPYLAALALSHLAGDFASIAMVREQFAGLLADPGARTVGPVGPQPVDQAGHERTPLARRTAEAALRYWDTQLRAMPQCVFSVPHQGPAGNREGHLRSRAAGLVLPALAARTGAGHSTVLLAAFATLLGVRTGNPRGALVSICGNRFRPGMAGFVGTIAQDALVPFELGASTESTVDTVVAGMRVATMSAYRHSQFEARRLYPVMDAIAAERGTRFHRDCVFNDVGAHREDRPVDATPPNLKDVVRALRDTTFQWLHRSSYPVACYLTVLRAGREVELTLYGDTRYLPDVEEFLRAIETLVIASAKRPVPVADVSKITGIRPVERGPDWVWLDSCWVDPAAVQALLDDVLDGRPSLVVARPGRLTAYVADPGRSLTPHQVHQRCVAALAGRYTAVAPSRYVICARAPGNPHDAGAWAAQPVVAQGSGRLVGKQRDVASH